MEEWWRDTSGMNEYHSLLFPLVVAECRRLGMRFRPSDAKKFRKDYRSAEAMERFWHWMDGVSNYASFGEAWYLGKLRELTIEDGTLPSWDEIRESDNDAVRLARKVAESIVGDWHDA